MLLHNVSYTKPNTLEWEELFLFLCGCLIHLQGCQLYCRLAKYVVCKSVLCCEAPASGSVLLWETLRASVSFLGGLQLLFLCLLGCLGFFLIKLWKSKVMFTGKMLLEERPSSCQNVIVYFRYNDFWRQVNGLQGAAVGWVLLGWAHVASGFQSCFCLRFLESRTKHLAVPVPLILSCLKCRK